MEDALTRERLCGSWELISWRTISPVDGVTHPHTERPLGRVIYEASGRMAVFLVHPDWERDDVDHGFIAYSGRFEFEDGKVRHIVDLSNQRFILGADLVRQVSLEGDILVLETPTNDDPAARWVLEWRRAGPATPLQR